MDYQFYFDPITDEPVADLSTEQELFGRWLTDELAGDSVQLVNILRALELLKEGAANDREFHGREISLVLSEDEATVQLNHINGHMAETSPDIEGVIPGEFDPDLQEKIGQASCGAEDLAHLLRAWQTFVTR